ncbi:outer membrane lipid asymmetry maintenance protein MlaD [Denitrobaculum tricleocarpae]|uniref:Outer membrane lipid asymmetry maintenance protein MlaD n=1 Tax=Denitrobaculum tricleocarpae TaxID=2591009 RepID=A0A545TWL9_9PROT|nr:outer membrane lipid asymmetry maintenance protein MlaD [Denitrobaculum tricleocarpae]TQV81610.1 outer membrane lipid asymmetry maintenance protein MlaD [Denitrobaculum tricleocarpae]
MRRNIIETIMGGIVILVAVFFVVFAFNSSGVGTIDGYRITAEFDDATGLAPGTDVRLAGVKIGTVVEQSLNPDTYFAQIVLQIDEEIQLPVGTSARIISDGLLGGNFVSLTPGGDDENIPAGGEIEYTQGSINVVDLLGRFVFSAADSNGEGSSDADTQDNF